MLGKTMNKKEKIYWDGEIIKRVVYDGHGGGRFIKFKGSKKYVEYSLDFNGWFPARGQSEHLLLSNSIREYSAKRDSLSHIS